MMEPPEPTIIVNGVELTEGQAMTLRVALTTFHMEMGEPGALFDDEHGRAMAKNYRARAEEVFTLMTCAARGRKDDGK